MSTEANQETAERERSAMAREKHAAARAAMSPEDRAKAEAEDRLALQTAETEQRETSTRRARELAMAALRAEGVSDEALPHAVDHLLTMVRYQKTSAGNEFLRGTIDGSEVNDPEYAAWRYVNAYASAPVYETVTEIVGPGAPKPPPEAPKPATLDDVLAELRAQREPKLWERPADELLAAGLEEWRREDEAAAAKEKRVELRPGMRPSLDKSGADLISQALRDERHEAKREGVRYKPIGRTHDELTASELIGIGLGTLDVPMERTTTRKVR